MLNRLFIVVGLLAILLLAAAFIVPRFVTWGDFRPRLEALASDVLGAKVEIIGDIEFQLLPQPQLKMARVVVGPTEAPVMMIEGVEAEFSLLDFLRDQYRITRLELNRPILEAKINADGQLDSGLLLAAEVKTANVAVANATIVGGSVRLTDLRSGETLSFEGVAGDLKIDALRGPFAFQGNGQFDGTPYEVRLSTTQVDDDGNTQLSAYLRQSDENLALSIDGKLVIGATPHLSGKVLLRGSPPGPKTGEMVDAGRGDMVLTSTIEVGTTRVLLSDFSLVPDENRAATRLTGALEINLGAHPAFNAVVSGGVLALPPRDATTEPSQAPYELVRLLDELPLPLVPRLPGTIGLDIAELNLRALSLRSLTLDAKTDTKSWTIGKFAAALPGGASVGLRGDLSVVDGHPIFVGGFDIKAPRLDALARLWRKPDTSDALLNLDGSLGADVALSSDTLALSGGALVINGINQTFDAQVGFGANKRLAIDAHFTTLGPVESAALAALLPDPGTDAAFGVTFPKGTFSVAASKAIIGGLEGTDLAAIGSWEGGILEFTRLAAGDLGGAQFETKLTAFGSLAKPELSGSGKLVLGDGGAPALKQVLDLLPAPKAVVEAVRRWAPADLTWRLDAPSGDGSQILNVTGAVGVASLDATLGLSHGLVAALSNPLAAHVALAADDATGLTVQLGAGDISLVPEDAAMSVTADFDGAPANSFATGILIEGGGDSLRFDGNVVVSDPARLTGKGVITVALSDLAAVTKGIGVDGIFVAPVNGSATLEFAGGEMTRLSDIAGVAGGRAVRGGLTLTRRGAAGEISGDLSVDHFDVAGLLPLVAGPQAMLNAAGGAWPDGPLDLGSEPGQTTGRVKISAGAMTAGPRSIMTDASFGLDWDSSGTHVRNFSADTGSGQVTADFGLCCAGPLAAKQVSGRLTLQGVGLDAIAPPAIAEALGGTVNAGIQFSGTGDGVAAAIAGMTGSGSYEINNFSIAHFDPGAFDMVAGLENVVDIQPEMLSQQLIDRLGKGRFMAPMVSGAFTIAGGVLRNPNVSMEGLTARVFGGVNLDLKTLQLDGSYLMTPKAAGADAAAQASLVLKGDLNNPLREFDVSAMVDAIMVKAYEAEVVRLEKIQAEDEARQKAEADERARIAAEQKALADAAAKKAADAAAANKAAADAAQQQAPLDLGL